MIELVAEALKLAPLIEKSGAYAILAFVLAGLFWGIKVLAPLFVEWARERWQRRITIEEELRDRMEEMGKRLSRLEAFEERVNKEVPDIGEDIAARLVFLEVTDGILDFLVQRLKDFRAKVETEVPPV